MTSMMMKKKEEEEEEEEAEEEKVKSPVNLKSRSMQEILESSREKGVAGITHHGGSHLSYMASKVLKLQTLHTPDEKKEGGGHDVVSSIFKECYLFVNGDTTPPRYEIQRLVMKHGGHFDAYKTSRTTHFLCDHFPNTKVVELSKNHPRIKIKYVTAAWFTSSISAGKRLSEALFTPQELKHGQKKLPFGQNDGNKNTNEVLISANHHVTSGSFDSPPKISQRDGIEKEAISYPSVANRTASDPNYMKQFFGASRLHFIGTWRSRLPNLVEELAAATTSVSDRERSHHNIRRFEAQADATWKNKSIIHIDMDCFFVSVLLRSRPELHAKPVAVAHSRAAGASEVSSCNYSARKFGVKAGMFMKRALELCPGMVALRYDFVQYEEVSKTLYKLCLSFSPIVQPVSVDELYIECPAGHDAAAAAHYLRKEIFRQTGCSASAGVGQNMLLARLATAKAKPDGLFVVPSDSKTDKSAAVSATMNFMATVPISTLPGVGRKLLKKIKRHVVDMKMAESPSVGHDGNELKMGANSANGRTEFEEEEDEEDMDDGMRRPNDVSNTSAKDIDPTDPSNLLCGALWPVPLSTLNHWIGGAAVAKSLFDSCRGKDERGLKSINEIAENRKSVGAEVNYGHRYETDRKGTAMEKAESFLRNLCEEVAKRLLQAHMVGYCITVKLMKRRENAPLEPRKFLGHGACDNMSKSHSLSVGIGRVGTSMVSSPPNTGSAVADADTVSVVSNAILTEAILLFRSMVSPFQSEGKDNRAISTTTFPPEDIRGMGVQLTRLEKGRFDREIAQGGRSGGTSRPLDMLFASSAIKRTSTSLENNCSNELPPRSTRRKPNNDNDDLARTMNDSWKDDILLPAASQIDHSVLAQLETDMKNSSAVLSGGSLRDQAGDRMAPVFARNVPTFVEFGEDLSFSQADFMRSIPSELHGDALRQLPQRTTDATTFNRPLDMDEEVGDQEIVTAVRDELNESLQSSYFDVTLSAPPSAILPHKLFSLTELREILLSWSTNDAEELDAARSQALSSYAIWLVYSKQLDKARSFLRLMSSLEENCRISDRQQYWTQSRHDVESAIQLSCRDLYGCRACL